MWQWPFCHESTEGNRDDSGGLKKRGWVKGDCSEKFWNISTTKFSLCRLCFLCNELRGVAGYTAVSFWLSFWKSGDSSSRLRCWTSCDTWLNRRWRSCYILWLPFKVFSLRRVVTRHLQSFQWGRCRQKISFDHGGRTRKLSLTCQDNCLKEWGGDIWSRNRRGGSRVSHLISIFETEDVFIFSLTEECIV